MFSRKSRWKIRVFQTYASAFCDLGRGHYDQTFGDWICLWTGTSGNIQLLVSLVNPINLLDHCVETYFRILICHSPCLSSSDFDIVATVCILNHDNEHDETHHLLAAEKRQRTVSMSLAAIANTFGSFEQRTDVCKRWDSIRRILHCYQTLIYSTLYVEVSSSLAKGKQCILR